MKELLRKKMQKLHITMGKKGQLWYSIYFAITFTVIYIGGIFPFQRI